MNKIDIDVVMVTYNQEKYIAQAIESVLMQKTNFSFRLLIGEDCSTDNTGMICQEYKKKFPEQIKLILHDKNQGLLKNYKSVFDVSTAKYLAILEGDDYWINDLKLQMQFDILERNNQIGLVHTNFNIRENQKIFPFKSPQENKLKGKVFHALILGNFIGPLSVCFRKDLMDKHFDYDFLIKNDISSIDYCLWLELSANSDFEYIEESTAVYRKLSSSISNSNDFKKKEIFLISSFKTIEYFANKYSVSDIDKEFSINNLRIKLMLSALNMGDYDKAKKYASMVSPKSFKELLAVTISKNFFLMKTIILIKKTFK